MQFKSSIQLIMTGLCVLLATSLHAEENQTPIVVFAAASLTNAVTDIVKSYVKAQPVHIDTSFASSSVLAKQIAQGAPADIFISADTSWMAYLKDKQVLQDNTITNVLTNHLVLIAPQGKRFNVTMDKTFDFFSAFTGKLCTGEMESVPAGIYAKQALTALGWLQAGKSRIVGTQDVRAALTLVARGECDVGIVYATDAQISDKVQIFASFPESTHAPIVYPITLTKSASLPAVAFYHYLKSEPAKAIFKRYGFSFPSQLY